MAVDRLLITLCMFCLGLGLAKGQTGGEPPKSENPPIIFRPMTGSTVGSSLSQPNRVAPKGMIIFSPQKPSGSTRGNSNLPTRSGSAAPASSPPLPGSTSSSAVSTDSPAAGSEPKFEGRTLFDYWFVAAVDGVRIGYLHWAAREIQKDGRTLWVGSKYQKLTTRRFGQLVEQWSEEGSTETPKGEVLLTTFSQGLGKDQKLAITGVVEGKVLRVTGSGIASTAEDKPWPEGVVGVVGEPLQYAKHRPRVGDTFSTLIYVPALNRILKTTTRAEAEEELVLWPGTPPRKLIRLVTTLEPVGNFHLPAQYFWVDATSYEPLKSEFDFPPLGERVTFLRTTRAAATAPVTNPPDVFNVQSIRLDRVVPQVHSKARLTYRITMERDPDPTNCFATDARQQVKNVDSQAKRFDLLVKAIRQPLAIDAPSANPGAEFLASNFFINSDDELVKAHALKAIATLPKTASAWERALAVEKWVKDNMKSVDFSQSMATADNVARTLVGDCTEFAMLAAAMCRALGIPSRTALGLVYIPDAKGGNPLLAYHMWVEVFVDGQWLGLDPVLGFGGIGTGHIKITDHSWHNERSFTPLLPVLRVLMAKPTVQVLEE